MTVPGLSGILGNSEQKSVLQAIEQLIQFSYLFLQKRNFSGLLFFRVSWSELEFPGDYWINIATCLFARYSVHTVRILVSEQTASVAVLHFGHVFVFCSLINESAFEWFLLIMCK